MFYLLERIVQGAAYAAIILWLVALAFCLKRYGSDPLHPAVYTQECSRCHGTGIQELQPEGDLVKNWGAVAGRTICPYCQGKGRID